MKYKNVKHKFIWFIPFIIWIILFFLFHTVFFLSRVPSNSMEPTIKAHSYCIGKRTYKKLQSGDIIIFRKNDCYYIKRIIGCPGDTIQIKDNHISLNDNDLSEPYVLSWSDNLFSKKYFVPVHSYFVLGDNRDHSFDSRYYDETFISEDDIVAKIIP